jgi:hypothetical protein
MTELASPEGFTDFEVVNRPFLVIKFHTFIMGPSVLFFFWLVSLILKRICSCFIFGLIAWLMICLFRLVVNFLLLKSIGSVHMLIFGTHLLGHVKYFILRCLGPYLQIRLNLLVLILADCEIVGLLLLIEF